MGHKSSDAAGKDVQIILWEEECAWGTGQRPNENCAAVRGAQIEPTQEECAFDMGQSTKDAAEKDAQTKFSVKEFVEGTEHIALHKTNLLHLDQSSSWLLQFRPYRISVLQELPLEEKKRAEFPTRWSPSVKK